MVLGAMVLGAHRCEAKVSISSSKIFGLQDSVQLGWSVFIAATPGLTVQVLVLVLVTGQLVVMDWLQVVHNDHT